MKMFNFIATIRKGKAYSHVINFLLCLSLLFLLWVIIQFLFLASFRINSDSMQPSLMQGDHILVNKTIPGARIFNLLASLRGEQVKISRLPRTQAIKKGDVLVFNNPFPYGNKKIRMHIMNYYAKRCAGLPGDSLKENKNNTLSLTYIPKSGDCVIINQNNYFLYHKLIAWEQQEIVELRDSLVYLNGKLLTEYCFQKNYYYMLGDNEALSHDSRFWGLLPEEYIVGKAWVIWKSKDTETNKIRWNRFLKKI